MTDANDDRPIFLKPGHNAGDLLESRDTMQATYLNRANGQFCAKSAD